MFHVPPHVKFARAAPARTALRPAAEANRRDVTFATLPIPGRIRFRSLPEDYPSCQVFPRGDAVEPVSLARSLKSGRLSVA